MTLPVDSKPQQIGIQLLHEAMPQDDDLFSLKHIVQAGWQEVPLKI